jgi:hypothetical protein
MTLGVDNEPTTVNQGDTADLYAYIFDSDDNPILAANIAQVEFKTQLPDGNQVTQTGTIESDGAANLRFTNTNQIGEYSSVAKFTLNDGTIRSTRIDFSTVDPFDLTGPTGIDLVTDTVWTLLEDCFDSEEGGPWLRDETLSYFNRAKVKFFVPFGILEINVVPPETQLTLVDFTTPVHDGSPTGSPNVALPLLAYGTLIHVVMHLMRAYVEQPTPQGAQVVYDDRRDYLQRWQIILTQIEPEFRRMVTLWKRQFLHLGKSALLVHSKAGRLYGPGYRMRNVGRGYY